MPSNQTPNYKLSQWEKSDRIQMEDFNADNAKLDAALKAETDARTTLADQVAKCGNCKIYTTTYTGKNGGADNPVTITFPGKPVIVFATHSSGYVRMWAVRGMTSGLGLNDTRAALEYITWSGNSVSWYLSGTNAHHMDESGTFYVVALLAADQR